jgi:copper homeostasis protein CutC
MQTIFLDIQEFKSLGVQGFVLGMHPEAIELLLVPTISPGMLETTGRVDIPNMRMAAKLADPLEGKPFSTETAVPYSPSLNFPK